MKTVSLWSRSTLAMAGLLAVAHAGQAESQSCPPDPGIYEVIAGESEARVLVYRAGVLGGLGHNHVISTANLEGRIEIADDPAEAVVLLTIPVADLEVDIDELRDEEGKAFQNKVSEKDKAGTRKNMLGPKLLDGGNFKFIEIRARQSSGSLPEINVTSEVTVKGQVRVLDFPVSVSVGEEEIVATGRFVLTHGELGLTPFKAALGTLRVHDRMELKFRITARKPAD